MTEEMSLVVCPICGSPAETGAIYSRSHLEWMSGVPTWPKKIFGGLFGQMLGEVGLFWASYVPGIFCPVCEKVIVDKKKQIFPNYYPEVKQ